MESLGAFIFEVALDVPRLALRALRRGWCAGLGPSALPFRGDLVAGRAAQPQRHAGLAGGLGACGGGRGGGPARHAAGRALQSWASRRQVEGGLRLAGAPRGLPFRHPSEPAGPCLCGPK